MVIFGLDISHHQDLGLDLERCKREGIDFVFVKATEGASFVDSAFAANLAEARAAGLLVAAYHYVRDRDSAGAQLYNIARTVPKDVPVILDVEAGSGNIVTVRELIDALRILGYIVPLLYLPQWYWHQLGAPRLAGLPPLWSSRYPDTVVGALQSEWAAVPERYWSGYGGLDVAVLQFTSSVRIAGHAPLDANAFRGSRTELAALLGHTDTLIDNLTDDTEDSDMKTFWVRGDAVGEMGSAAPTGFEHTKWGDAVFHVDATADGLRRRHISADEWAAVAANGAKVIQRPQAWVDSIPYGEQSGLFPWTRTAPAPVGYPQIGVTPQVTP
jgi:hypothetical protein